MATAAARTRRTRDVVPLPQSNFVSGVLSPELHGRHDLAVIGQALSTCDNAMTRLGGAVENRAGFEFLVACKNATASRLIPFEASPTETYMIEVGDKYFRFLRDAGPVVKAATFNIVSIINSTVTTATAHGLSTGDQVYFYGIVDYEYVSWNNYLLTITQLSATTFTTNIPFAGYSGNAGASGYCVEPYEITTPYLEAELPQLKFTASNDVMTFTHPNHPVYELRRGATDVDWTFEQVTFEPTLDRPWNAGVYTSATVGSENYQYALTRVSSLGDESLPRISKLLTLSGVVSATRSIWVFLDRSTLQGLSGVSSITQANPAVVTDTTLTLLTAVYGRELQDGDLLECIESRFLEMEGEWYYASSINYTTGTFELIEVSTGNTLNTLPMTIHKADLFYYRIGATSYENVAAWRIYRRHPLAPGSKADELWGFLFERVYDVWLNESQIFTDYGNIAPDYTSAPPDVRTIFDAASAYPGCVEYYEQRLAFAGSLVEPYIIRASRSSAFHNFNTSQFTKDTDPIQASVGVRNVAEIRHLLDLNGLLALTASGEWIVSSSQDVLTPSTVNPQAQSYWGCAHVRPITVGNAAVFVTVQEDTLRLLHYSYDVSAFTGSDLTVLVRDFFEGHTVIDQAYTKTPNSVIWVVRDDGALLTMTFDQQQQVYAWHKQQIGGGGEVKAVASLFEGATTQENHAYVIVNRNTFLLSNFRSIERSHTRDFDTLEDAFFVDSGATLSTPELSPVLIVLGPTNPVKFYLLASGLANGDIVDVRGVKRWKYPNTDDFEKELAPGVNGQFKVANFVAGTPDTFEIADVDSGISVPALSGSVSWAVASGTVQTTVTSAYAPRHHAYSTVSVLANGTVYRDVGTDGDGGFSIPASSKIHAGNSYVSTVETLDLNSRDPKRAGALTGVKTRVASVILQHERSGPFQIGTLDGDQAIKWREDEAWGEATRLRTGLHKVAVKSDWHRGSRLVLRQSDPVPFRVLSLVPEVEIGGS